MENSAVTTYPVISVISNRWSPRSFDPARLLDTDTIGSLFEAARWAPSASNEQPWRYLIGVNFNEEHRAILDCISESNGRWAQNAPLLIIAVGKTTRNDLPNRHFAHDVGLSLENLFLQAIGMGRHEAGVLLDERGSNVDLVDEAVTRLTASRAYEANLVSLQAQSDISRSLLEL